MIKKSFILHVICFLCVARVGLSSTPIGNLNYTLYLSDASNDFTWIRKGSIFWGAVRPPSGANQMMLLYKEKGGSDLLPLRGSLSSVVSLIRSEIVTSEVKRFVASDLAIFISMAMAQDRVRILDERFAGIFKSNIRFGGSMADYVRILPYCKGVAVVQDVGEWRIAFDLFTSYGGVQEWRLRGKYALFSIDEMLVSTIFDDGSIRPPSEAR